MTRINLMLLLALLASGLYLVHVSYDARRLFAELDRARTLEGQLEADYRRLKGELQSEAAPLKVEKAARERLHMRTTTAAVTHYVTYTKASAVLRAEPAP